MSPVQAFVRRPALAVLAAVFLAACSGGSGSQGPSTPSPTTQPPVSPTPSPSVSGGATVVQVWFTRDQKLFETERRIPETQAVGTAALNELLAGPSADESAAGVSTQAPSDTQLMNLSIADGVATVDLNDAFSLGDRSEFSQRARLGQVVYTLTQFPTVQGVRFELEGSPILTFDRKGAPVHRPSTRVDYGDLLPAILVESPAIGEFVSSPVTVAGTADVFEATVSIRILDENGHVIAHDFVTASCGSGCRGDYSKEISFSVTGKTAGTVMVFEESAENGKPINVQKIPVTLSS